MPEKKGARGQKPIPPPPDVVGDGGDVDPQTSTRLFVKEAVKLGKLASLRGQSIAVSFRQVFGKVLDAALVAAAANTIEELKDGN
jgi:hypothetical protein